MDVVFAKTTQIVGEAQVIFGQHWPATDPFVAEHPELFSRDPRWGMAYSVEPPGYRDGTNDLTEAPAEPPLFPGGKSEPETAPRRARSRTDG